MHIEKKTFDVHFAYILILTIKMEKDILATLQHLNLALIFKLNKLF